MANSIFFISYCLLALLTNLYHHQGYHFLFYRIYHHLQPMFEFVSYIIISYLHLFSNTYLHCYLCSSYFFFFTFVFAFKRIYHHLQPMDQDTIFAVGVTFISCPIDFFLSSICIKVLLYALLQLLFILIFAIVFFDFLFYVPVYVS